MHIGVTAMTTDIAVAALSVAITFTVMCTSGRGVLPYIGYKGMCGWKGYAFQAFYSGIGSSNRRKLV